MAKQPARKPAAKQPARKAAAKAAKAPRKIEELDKNLKAAVPTAATPELRWLPGNAAPFVVRGLGWFGENGGAYNRLPLRAKGVVRDPVWELGCHTAGARLCFRTDATMLHVRAKLLHANVMSHMPLTGSSGLALYEGDPRQELPGPVAFPGNGEREYERVLFTGRERRLRTYTLYLPLYNGLESLSLGVNPEAKFEAPPAPLRARPIVWYGTSITQGGCAHNPGADYPAIVARALGLDVINLGFSGNGRGEPEVANLLAELDAELFVLDYVSNAGAEGLDATVDNVIATLRAQHPTTPIALVSRLFYSQVHYVRDQRAAQERIRDICLRHYLKHRDAGDANVHFIDGNTLIPFGTQLAYSDAGVHPSNHGYYLMAQAFLPQISYLLHDRY
jgi:hypothetical protein